MNVDLSKDTLFSTVVFRLRSAGCVYAEEETRLLMDEAETPAQLDAMINQRMAGYPLEHIVGWAELCGFRIEVDPDVFVPRRRTEFLVAQAANIIRPGDIVVDLCCGSGAAGAILAASHEDIQLYASDIDPKAVQCARRNIDAFGGHAYQGDLYEPLPETLRGSVNVLVANAPYVPTDAIGLLPAEARLHEDRIALDGGKDGLDIQRRVAAGAPNWLAPGGYLLVETSDRQAPLSLATFTEIGLLSRVVSSSELESTVVMGMKPKT
ncbi:putative protein N(5)-glutamine methyltransferase [Fictibacillus terranigra]|uniref:peptide chain release factor N(5)-glutamine methyltransferase n=1 Tax=Fictibacillus terranigra TaxID=3058424 RepID=A0ABT8E227_9BACL|nr:putative protein N(5)-glutamine methyltransferase [Fictibacillus sp. CENA-BCM004]MDN4071959.1 putative protein N(5)-glutamine methyltransferase [Fictibacillus sp. CENA-BCM004]